MNILSSPLWPSDMPDDRRVIALLGLVQISEEGMTPMKEREYEHKIAFLESQLATAEAECMEQARLNGMGGEREADLRGKIERLNALLSMQAEALNNADYAINGREHTGFIHKALSATSETVSAYQNEVKAKALENAIQKIQALRIAHDPRLAVPGDEYYAKVISVLRAKGE